MPKIAKELKALAVSRLKETGFHPVGGVPGLLLCVKESGSRNWILRVTIGDKRRDVGLGGYPAVTLADARDKARETRDKIKAGGDPVLESKSAKSRLIAEQARQITFAEAVKGFLEGKSGEWKNAKHAAQWETTLTNYAEPVLGKILVKDIDVPHVLKVLLPIWKVKTETASRVRGRIESVLAWATVHKHRQGPNPAVWRGNLSEALAKPGKIAKVEHHPALPYKELGDFMANLRQREGMGAKALEFAILTAARSGEVRGATRKEIDMDAATWTIPGRRMKAGKEHRVPLSRQAVALLKSLPKSKNPYVFSAIRGGMLSDMTLSSVTRRMEVDAVPHGFRSSFRDWAGETTAYPREVIEHALAHQLADKAEAAYARGTLFEKRQRLMQDWANYCGKPSAKMGEVISIRGRKI